MVLVLYFSLNSGITSTLSNSTIPEAIHPKTCLSTKREKYITICRYCRCCLCISFLYITQRVAPTDTVPTLFIHQPILSPPPTASPLPPFLILASPCPQRHLKTQRQLTNPLTKWEGTTVSVWNKVWSLSMITLSDQNAIQIPTSFVMLIQ